MSETPTGWALLHSKLPASAIKPLATSVYGVAGLSDVNEGYLVRRLFLSGLDWHWKVIHQEYLGAEDRAVRDKDYTQRYYLAMVHGELAIDGRVFHGSGGSDNRKLDAALKGAGTVAFKNACKWAGLTAELFLEGKAIDDIHQARVTKDPDTTSMTVEQRVAENLATYPLPQAAQDSEPMVLPQAAADTEPKTNGSGESAPPEGVQGERSEGAHASAVTPALPLIPSDEDLADLFVLGRTLKTPATAVQIRNQVAETNVEAVRRRLILAHAEPRNCGKSPCSHVAVLAGLK